MIFWPLIFGILVIIGGVVVLALAVTAALTISVYSNMKTEYVPNVVPVDDEDLRDSFIGHLRNCEEMLAQLGLAPAATFRFSNSNEVEITARIYTSTTGPHNAMLTEALSPAVHTQIVEFCTRLSPHGEISTNNSSSPLSLSHPPDWTEIHLPTIASIEELFEYHKAFCAEASAQGFTPLSSFVRDWPEEIEKQFARGYNLQVKLGRLKRTSDGGFRFTLLGAIRAVPPQILHMTFGRFFRRRLQEVNRLRHKVHDRYAAARNMPEELKSYHKDIP